MIYDPRSGGVALARSQKGFGLTFFESLLALMAVAILLLQLSRRLEIPYPTMLAAAGVALALIPGAPKIGLDPRTALALFIAPSLVNEAFDFPLSAIRRLWRPLIALAVVVVLVSAGAVAWLGMAMAGLPFYAALALGAIVAPPDAAAATAVLSNISMPRRSIAVLKGESLLNDATALLLFSAATSAQHLGGFDGTWALRLTLAAPGGVVLGILLGRLYRHIIPLVSGTLGGNLLEFVTCFGVWIIADRLHLSAVLCLVAFSITLAGFVSLMVRPRMRIHSYAVWESAVFLLNVFAFLLLGFQARTIVGSMAPARLHEALWFAVAVVLCLIVVRMVLVVAYNRLAFRYRSLRAHPEPPTLRQGILVGWSGMRGLVTLATAFALPPTFPQRDLIVLTAFAVVLATLVIQGLTLGPLVRLLKLDGDDGLGAELDAARVDLAGVGLATLEGKDGPAADFWRYEFETLRDGALLDGEHLPLELKRQYGLKAVRKQRKHLQKLRNEEHVGADAYLVLQEELDFAEVALNLETDQHIEEG
jgi:monovalent cation/hydrogen antiporter